MEGSVEEAHQVDVRGVVQLPRTHLAHGEHHHALAPRKPPPRDLPPEGVGQRRLHRAVGQIRQRARHLLETPDAAQVRQPRQKRQAPLDAPQGGAGIALHRLHQERVARRLGRPGQRAHGPFRLAREELGEIRAAGRRRRGEVAHGPGGKDRGRLAAPLGLVGYGRASDAIGEGHGGRCPRRPAAVNRIAPPSAPERGSPVGRSRTPVCVVLEASTAAIRRRPRHGVRRGRGPRDRLRDRGDRPVGRPQRRRARRRPAIRRVVSAGRAERWSGEAAGHTDAAFVRHGTRSAVGFAPPALRLDNPAPRPDDVPTARAIAGARQGD